MCYTNKKKYSHSDVSCCMFCKKNLKKNLVCPRQWSVLLQCPAPLLSPRGWAACPPWAAWTEAVRSPSQVCERRSASFYLHYSSPRPSSATAAAAGAKSKSLWCGLSDFVALVWVKSLLAQERSGKFRRRWPWRMPSGSVWWETFLWSWSTKSWWRSRTPLLCLDQR